MHLFRLVILTITVSLTVVRPYNPWLEMLIKDVEDILDEVRKDIPGTLTEDQDMQMVRSMINYIKDINRTITLVGKLKQKHSDARIWQKVEKRMRNSLEHFKRIFKKRNPDTPQDMKEIVHNERKCVLAITKQLLAYYELGSDEAWEATSDVYLSLLSGARKLQDDVDDILD